MTTQNPVPARLFVLLARTAPVGVILRRGPSDWVQMIRWDTKNDVFTPGQWFHGRIYEYACELSPDGSLILYFATKYNAHTLRERKPSWTAISKPPYFTALRIWFDGYGGGFEDEHSVWVNGYAGETRLIHIRSGKVEPSPPTAPSFDLLERSGWQVAPDGQNILTKQVSPYALFRDRFHDPPYGLYRLVDQHLNQEIVLEEAQWADFDQRERLVFAREGKLVRATIMDTGELELKEIADFNAHTPEPLKAPKWARKW